MNKKCNLAAVSKTMTTAELKIKKSRTSENNNAVKINLTQTRISTFPQPGTVRFKNDSMTTLDLQGQSASSPTREPKETMIIDSLVAQQQRRSLNKCSINITALSQQMARSLPPKLHHQASPLSFSRSLPNATFSSNLAMAFSHIRPL